MLLLISVPSGNFDVILKVLIANDYLWVGFYLDEANSSPRAMDITIWDAREFFDAVLVIAGKLRTLMEVGFTCVRLG